MAGAIQDTGRGILVGTKTFGKGSVQDWIALSNNAGAVRVTIARWLTPNERLIHEIGIEPDVVVPLTEDDIQAGLDPQFDKAVEVMLGMVR
jgi:carboxyl-terminal processing protease